MVKRDGVILEKAALRAVTSFSFREGFLSLVRGTERVVKTIEDRWGKYSTVGRFPSSSLRGEDRDERWSPL